MTWKRVIVVGLVFGIPGVAYLAWQARRDKQARQRLASLAAVAHEEVGDDWCDCTATRTCEGHRS